MVSKSSSRRLRESKVQDITWLLLAWYPAYRRQELYLGMFTEQENLIVDVKWKSREPVGKGWNSDATFRGRLTRSSDFTREMIGESQ